MGIIDNILTCNHFAGTPLYIVEVLMAAAADKNIHLDCSYLLLRREPDVLFRLLSEPHNNNNNNNDGDSGGRGGGGDYNNDNDVVVDDDDENGIRSYNRGILAVSRYQNNKISPSLYYQS